MELDPLLFGDNQFFGVNHMSEEKARQQAMQFQDLRAILDVLGVARTEGVNSFMCTTHDRVGEIANDVRGHPDDYRDFRFLPCMPYAHKYANAATEHGMVGALQQFVPEDGLFNAVTRGGRSIASRDLDGLTTLLIDAEMRMFAGLPTPVVFLQNVVVDLLLGLGAVGAFGTFARHVRARYGAEPGFITMNLPLLLPALEAADVANPVVCFNMNKIGFRMCGGLDAYQGLLSNGGFRAVAMSVFASGAIEPRQAVDWLFSQPGIDSMVFGASSARNIRSTVELVSEHRPVGV